MKFAIFFFVLCMITVAVADPAPEAELDKKSAKAKTKKPKTKTKIKTATSSTSSSSTFDVSSVISNFYPTSTPRIEAAASTSLASLLYQVQTSWEENSVYATANAAIISAAPSAVRANSYDHNDIVTASWFTTGVESAVQTAIRAQASAVASAKAEGEQNAAPVVTAAPVLAIAVAAVGVVLAAV